MRSKPLQPSTLTPGKPLYIHIQLYILRYTTHHTPIQLCIPQPSYLIVHHVFKIKEYLSNWYNHNHIMYCYVYTSHVYGIIVHLTKKKKKRHIFIHHNDCQLYSSIGQDFFNYQKTHFKWTRKVQMNGTPLKKQQGVHFLSSSLSCVACVIFFWVAHSKKIFFGLLTGSDTPNWVCRVTGYSMKMAF